VCLPGGDRPAPRVIEIGDFAYIALAYPQNATIIWTAEESHGPPAPANLREFGLTEMWRLMQAAHAGKIDLIVLHVDRNPPWHWRHLRCLLHRPFRPWQRLLRMFGTFVVRLLPKKIPLFVIDTDDMRTIARHSTYLLDRCTYYFKRELPVDRWQVFQQTAHPEMPSTRFRRRARNRARIAKLRPWSIGFRTESRPLPPAEFPDKTIDLLAAVSVNSSTVRMEGIAELRALSARRPGIMIVDRRLPLDEYLRMMSQSWLTWSPEGFGWDCIRHYEAAVCQSVPVINRSTIIRYRPFIEGTHALHYDPDVPGGLTGVIERALADLPRLRAMAIAAREHVARFHLMPWSYADALLSYLSGEQPPGGLDLMA